MYRENFNEFALAGPKTMCIPKNGGLRSYIVNMLPEIGIVAQQQGERLVCEDANLEIILARGEDIPRRVAEMCRRGEKAYGLTGDDLYDEFRLGEPTSGIGALCTYDWFDMSAEFRRPALCLMSPVRTWAELPQNPRVAVNRKYELQARMFLRQLQRVSTIATYAGDVERTVADRTNDCCIEIVYGGASRKEAGLEIMEVVRFSDICLIGRSLPNVWEMEYERICARRDNPTESQTSRLLQDQNLVCKKMGEESAEFLQACATGQGLVEESLDVIYAVMLGLARNRVGWPALERSLVSRQAR